MNTPRILIKLEEAVKQLRSLVTPEVETPEVIALHEYKALYYPIPKVACSSLKSICVDLLGIILPHDAWKPDVFQSTMYDSIIDKNSIYLTRKRASQLQGYWSFAFVRNPWDRLVSCYSEKIRADGDPENFVAGVSKVLLPYGVFTADMSFEEFARRVASISDNDAEPHFRSQYTFIYSGSGQSEVDFIGRFERLSADLTEVCHRLGCEVDIPHLLKSRRSGYQSYYDAGLADLVFQRYRRDIELFGYEF